MNLRKIIQIATETALSKNEWTNFQLGAVGVRNDGTIVKSSNGPTRDPCRHVHAEARLAKKLDYGATVCVVRVRRDGTLGISKPCHDCEKALRSKRVEKVFYINNMGHLEMMEF